MLMFSLDYTKTATIVRRMHVVCLGARMEQTVLLMHHTLCKLA